MKPKPLDLKKLKEKVKKEMRFIRELKKKGKIDEKTSNELRCGLGQLGYDIELYLKSALQGLLIDIEVTDLDEIVCSDGSHRRMDEKTRKRIITDLIQKWFPNMVNKDD